MKRKIVICISVATVIIMGLIIMIIVKKNRDHWRKGIYFLNHDIVLNTARETETVNLYAIVVGSDLLKDITECRFTSHLLTETGDEEVKYEYSVIRDFKEYALVQLNVAVRRGERYVGFLLKDESRVFQAQNNFDILVLSGDEKTHPSVSFDCSIYCDGLYSVLAIVLYNESDDILEIQRKDFKNQDWIKEEMVSRPYEYNTKHRDDFQWEYKVDNIVLPPKSQKMYQIEYFTEPFSVMYELPLFVCENQAVSYIKSESRNYASDKEKVLRFINGED